MKGFKTGKSIGRAMSGGNGGTRYSSTSSKEIIRTAKKTGKRA
jgi:hypothetical protein